MDPFIGPSRSIDKVWATAEPVGTAMRHPLSARTKMLAVESGNRRAGERIAEERDFTADWRRLVPGQARPKIMDLGGLPGTDSTRTQVGFITKTWN